MALEQCESLFSPLSLPQCGLMEAPSRADMGKKMVLPFLSAPSWGIRDPTKKGRLPTFFFFFNSLQFQVVELNSWWVHNFGDFFLYPTPTQKVRLSPKGSKLRIQGPWSLLLQLDCRVEVPHWERQAEKSRTHHFLSNSRSSGLETFFPGREAVHKNRKFWNFLRRNWLCLKQNVGKFKVSRTCINSGDSDFKQLWTG